MRPVGSAPVGDRRRRDPSIGAPGVPGPELGGTVYLLEVEARLPGSVGVAEDRGVGAAPVGAKTRRLVPRESLTTIRVSDLGYATAPGDAPGVVPYPPLLQQAFAMDRTLGLAPGRGVTEAWGRAVILNPDRRWDAVARAYNADGRRARVLAGRRRWDASRGLWQDPPYAALREVFAGLAEPWRLTDTALEIPLRDVGYWLERPLATGTWAGTGGYEGTADMAGQPRPLVVGGTLAAPVRQVTPVLVDPVARIYAAGGRVVTLYERGDPTSIPDAGDVADLYAGSTPAGQYRTCDARGMFQLQGAPAGALTVDVAAPGGASAAALARALINLAQVPAGLVDEASFAGLAAAWPQPCGWWWSGLDVQARGAVEFLLASVGAQLVTSRTGQLRAVALRVPPAGTRPVASYGPAEIVDLVPVDLGAPLSPAPAAWQVGWGRNHTTLTDGIDPDVSAEAARALGQAWRIAPAASPAVLAASRRPSRPGLVETAHLTAAGGQALADTLRDLWSLPGGRRLYRMTVPAEFAQRHEPGDPVVVAFPRDDLDGGRLAQVVGDSLQAGGDTGTYTILV